MNVILIILATLFFLMTKFVNTSAGDDTNITFGGCLPDKNNCSTCYTALKESLLKRDDNIQELSRKFYPPRANIPQVVNVTYHFGDNSNNTQVWFWTQDSSYLFFPIETFQFMSLFFGKPAAFFTQKMSLHMDEECFDVTHDILRLLTQRLKNFIQKSKFDPEIDDNYFARSQENIPHNSDDIISNTTAIYIVIFYCVGFLLSVAITAVILIIYLNTKRWDKKLKNLSTLSDANKYSQAKIFSVAITSFTISIYIVILDGFALYTWYNKEIDNQETNIQEPKVLHSLPVIVAFIDVLAITVWITFCTLGLCSQLKVCCKERLYTFLATSTLGPTLSLVIHLPYILIAYLNDATYASSIFIYYTIIVFILFGALDLSYGTCMGALIYRRDNPIQGQARENQPLLQDGNTDADVEQPNRQENRNQPLQEDENTTGCNPYPMFPCEENGIIITFAIATPVFILLIVVLMGMITATLVVIPISKALNDAPNRLLGFYQVVIVLVGAYFAYRKFFHKKPSLESVVEEAEKNIFNENGQSWEGLSNDQKLINFYTHIMTIVAKSDPHTNNIHVRQRSGQAESAGRPEGEVQQPAQIEQPQAAKGDPQV